MEHSKNFSKKLENIKSKQSELNNTINEKRKHTHTHTHTHTQTHTHTPEVFKIRLGGREE